MCVSTALEPCHVRLPSTDCSWTEPSMDFDFVEINWSLSLHWLKAAEHYRVDSEGSAGMTVGWPPVGCGWVPEACYLHPRLPWEPLVEGSWGKVPPPAPPPPPMLGLYLLFRSALPPCLVLWGVKFTLCFVVVVVVFHIFIVILVQALKVSSYTHRATPLPQCGWRQKLLRKELSSSLLEGRAGWAGKSTLHSSVGTGWHHSTARGWAGDDPCQALRGAQVQTLGKGPGNLSLKVAFLVVSVCRAEGLVFFFNLFCRAAWNPQGCSRPSGAQELCFGKCLENGWLCGLPMGPCSHRTVSCTRVFANCHKSRLLWTSGGLKPALY